MSVLPTATRRTVLALATVAVTVPMMAAGSTAQAAEAGGAPAAPSAAAAGVTGFTPSVSARAWQAGRTARGTKATAGVAVTDYRTPARMRAARPVEEAAQYAAARATPQAGLKPGATSPASSRELVVRPASGTVKAPVRPQRASDPGLMCPRLGSNQRPPGSEPDALSAELRGRQCGPSTAPRV
jgi:hypothetical protein